MFILIKLKEYIDNYINRKINDKFIIINIFFYIMLKTN